MEVAGVYMVTHQVVLVCMDHLHQVLVYMAYPHRVWVCMVIVPPVMLVGLKTQMQPVRRILYLFQITVPVMLLM